MGLLALPVTKDISSMAPKSAPYVHQFLTAFSARALASAHHVKANTTPTLTDHVVSATLISTTAKNAPLKILALAVSTNTTISIRFARNAKCSIWVAILVRAVKTTFSASLALTTTTTLTPSFAFPAQPLTASARLATRKVYVLHVMTLTMCY